MLKFCFILLVGMVLQKDRKWSNSIWSFEVVKRCINTLKLGPNGKALSYDCEIDYTFNCTYRIINDTLFITEKIDHNSEDGGKATYRRQQYIIKEQGLFCVSSGELVKGKWVDKKYKTTNKPDWMRSK